MIGARGDSMGPHNKIEHGKFVLNAVECNTEVLGMYEVKPLENRDHKCNSSYSPYDHDVLRPTTYHHLRPEAGTLCTSRFGNVETLWPHGTVLICSWQTCA